MQQQIADSPYRERVYGQYVNARQTPLAPTTVAGLAEREAFLKNLIRRHFPSRLDARILEIGCGHGALIHFAQMLGYTNIRGVDASPEQVEAAHTLGIRNVAIGDLQQTLDACPSESLDVVVGFDVIEHLTKAELLRLVDAVYRVLRPGASLIIHTVNGESPFVGRIRYGDFTHEQAFTRISISQLLLSSGFRTVTCFEDCPVPHGLKSATRAFVWKILRTFLQVYVSVETGSWDRRAVLTQNFSTVAIK